MDLDTRGLRCPMPIVKMSAELKKMANGERLTVMADDLAFPEDIKAWCRKTGNTLISLDASDPAKLSAVVEKDAS